ncbi:MAG: alpha/beta hydrolase [Planctomycetota bacterium]|nr:alpha/beta hydrolase [Planctomycetota bacterium]
MPLDPQVKAYLDELARQDIIPLAEMSIEEIRQGTRDESATLGAAETVQRIEDRMLPGIATDGESDVEIPIRIYTPVIAEPTDAGMLGAFVFYHGGGWVTGDIPTHEAICCRLANAAACVVVSVGYRCAPESKYPAAVNDALAATWWVHEHAAVIGVDPERIAVGGDSAGGNLAAAVALMLRDRNLFKPALQVLIYPVIDYSFDRPSYKENRNEYSLTLDKMRWFWDCYLARPEDGSRPYASPIRAESLSGLAPALVQTAEYDPLRDEGEDYARQLREAGVPVKLTRYDGMIHGFFRRGIMIDKANLAVREVVDALRKAFS